jgi:DurN substrate-assisted peptide maturase
VISDTHHIRRIQSVVVLLSCLPNNGKCREIFELALALDHGPPLSRLCAPREDLVRGHQPWLESLWARPEMDTDERRLIEWQNCHENMEVAIREIKAVHEAIDGIWMLR